MCCSEYHHLHIPLLFNFQTAIIIKKIIDNKYYLELPIVKAQNSEDFEIVQEDGQKLPEWIKIDPFTGQIIAEPPSDVENIKLKIISENEGGEVVIKEVQLDFNNQLD